MPEILIKKTKSLSPLSNEEIDAEVVLEDRKVYLKKQDEDGKQYKSLIDSNYDFYTMMTTNRCATQVEPNQIQIYVSGRCNLNCPLCYEYGNVSDEPSLDEIEKLVSKYKLKSIVLMGKEPTCRDDIFEIIKLASKENHSFLLTNGLKLVDYDYVAKLKEAGLSSIMFSFNGFDDKIYEEMNGRPLLDIKLRALENIKKVGIKTVLSATFNRGTNESEIQKIVNYCFENQAFIRQLRIRTASPVGQHLNVEPFCMSEFIDMISDALRIPRQDLYKGPAYVVEFAKEFDHVLPQIVKAFLRPRLCSFAFRITKKDGGYALSGADMDIESIKRSKFKKAHLLCALLKAYGFRNFIASVSAVLKLPQVIKGNTEALVVSLRSWPSIDNIDLEENRKCSSQYCKNGKTLPFCYSNILMDRVANRSKSEPPARPKQPSVKESDARLL
jgi:uncharacterized radical SAM superfamily Fe-S cluster-containing enzyme